MRPTPHSSRAIGRILLGLLLGVLALMRSLPIDPHALHAQAESGAVVRLAPADAAVLWPQDILRGASYGSFGWYEVRPSGIGHLDSAGVAYERFPHGTEISIGVYRFDPLVGEPALAPELQAGPEDGGPNLWLVQLIGPVKDEWLEALTAAGVARVQYHAEHSYAVWGSTDQVAKLVDAPYVRWLGRDQPGYRLAPELADASATLEISILAYEPAIEDVRRAIAELGGEILHEDEPERGLTRYLECRIDAGRLISLAHVPGVMALNAGTRRPVTLDEMSDKISAGMVNGTQPEPKPPGYRDGFLQPNNVSGAGVTVHINDAGIDESHIDLAGRMVAEYGNLANHHGTHVAGIAVGAGTNDIGDTSANGSWIYGLGMAPDASYIDEDFNCSPGTCMRHAVENNANVSSNSWGYATGGNGNAGYGYTANSRTFDALVQDANTSVNDAQPLTIVAAAGNEGSGSETIIEPWEAKNVISVASSRNWRNSSGNSGSGNIDTISSFSSRGKCRDGRNCPVVTAPGEFVISARYSTSGCGAQPAPNSNIHSVCSGTSMATPHVTGAVAVITEWWRNNHSGATQSPAMSIALVVNGAKDMSTADIPNINEGWGRVNVRDSISPTVAAEYWDQPVVFHTTGETWTVQVQAADLAKAMKLSLVWIDAPGAGGGGTSAAWVNNLDLQLSRSGTVYRGNNFSGGWSTSGGTADTKNNMENIYLQTPQSGSYTIDVIATNLAGDGVLYNGDSTDQHWALVCQNCIVTSGTPTPTPSATPSATATGNATPTGPSGLPTSTPFGTQLPTRTSTATATDTPVPTSTNTPTRTPTATPTRTSTATATRTSTATATRTATATATATNTPVPPSNTPTATATSTATATATPTNTPLPTATSTATATSTSLPTSTPTSASTPTATATATLVPTATDTPAPTATATATATDTPVPTSTATSTATHTSTPVPTATGSATATVTLTATSTATNIPTATGTATATATSTPTATNTPVPTSTDTASPSATASPTVTGTTPPGATDTATLVPTATDTPVPTATSSATATDTPVPTSTATRTATHTSTPVPTATNTATATVTLTATPTATNTPTPTNTATGTATATATSTPTATNTPVPTATNTLTATATATPTATNTPLPTASATATQTSTSVPTATPTAIPTATATSTATPGGPPPTHQQTVTGGSSSSATVTSSSLSAGSSTDIYLVTVSTRPNVAVSSVSGLGLSWAVVRVQCSARNQTRVEVWKAQGAGTSGTVVATLASAPSNAVIVVSRYSGSSGIGAVVSANQLGVNGACSGGTDTSSYSVNLTTTVNNALAYGAVALRNRTHTPGSGYTERADVRQGSSGAAAGAAVEDKVALTSGSVTVNGTFSGTVDWAVVAVEIKP